MKNRCSKCGEKADLHVKSFEGDFFKEITYCRECLKESLKRSKGEKLKMNLNFWSIVNSKPRIVVDVEMENAGAIIFLNESFKSVVGVELSEDERKRYEISRLRDAIAKAIKNENYELAGILQREIKKLKTYKKTR